MIDLAYSIAEKAHAGQKDKGGQDYFNHPLYVASLVATKNEKIVALLHDVVEDTDITIDYLKQQGFSCDIIDAIDAITKQENEPYEEYLKRLIQNKLAFSVKIADMTHNSDITRIPNPKQKDFDRVKKYKDKIEYLKSLRHL